MSKNLVRKTQPYAIAYLRVSTELQENVQGQLPRVEARAGAMGLKIPKDGVYTDEALSRDFFTRRLGLQAMLKRAEDPNCTTVIVNWYNRLYTSDNQKEIFAALRKAGVRLFDANGVERNTGSHEGEMVDFLDGWLSKGQVRFIRQSVMDSHRAKAMTGRFVGKPPYGIDVVHLLKLPCRGACGPAAGADCPVVHGTVSAKNGTVWVVNTEKQLILASIYSWLAEGLTIRQVERKCIELNYRPGIKATKKGPNEGRLYGGGNWSRANLIKMIRNEFYKGILIWGRMHTEHEGDIVRRVKTDPSTWVVTEHLFGELVPGDLWERANTNVRLRANTKMGEDRAYPEQLWEGYVYCGRCGWKMHARPRPVTRSGQLFDVYCQSRDSQYSRCTDSQSIPMHYLLPALRGDGPPQRGVEVTLELDERVDHSAEITLIQQELESLPNQIAKVKRLATTDFYDSDEEARDAKRDLVNRQTELTERLGELLAAPVGAVLVESLPAAASAFFELLNDERIPIETRRAELSRVVIRVLIDRPSVRFLLRKDFVEGAS